VRVQTRRNDGSWVYSENSTVQQIIVDRTGVAWPDYRDRIAGLPPQTE